MLPLLAILAITSGGFAAASAGSLDFAHPASDVTPVEETFDDVEPDRAPSRRSSSTATRQNFSTTVPTDSPMLRMLLVLLLLGAAATSRRDA